MLALGMLVGILCGLSSAAVTLPLMAALFSLVGGGLTTFLSRLDRAAIGILAGKLLAGFCLTCAVFLLLGIWAREHRWLLAADTPPGTTAPGVLKSGEVNSVELVKGLCANQQFGALADLVKGR